MSALRHISNFGLAPLAVVVSLGWAMPAQAQSAGDVAALRADMAAMRQAMESMAARVNTLEAQLADANAKADAASAAAASANAAAASASTTAIAVRDATKGVPKVNWKGAPEIEGEGGWSFKPRGRLQIDAGSVSAPSAVKAAANLKNPGGLGFANEMRRAYLGVDGKIPGGFSYRVEADFANSGVELTDLYVTYQASKALSFTAGQHKPFWGLEEITSDLFTTFNERAAINTAFGYERRVGLSAAYAKGDVLVQAGVFTDNAADLNNDENNSIGYDGRIVFMPKLAGGQLHLGGSVHVRDLKDSTPGAIPTVQYRVRPFMHTTDTRFIDTGKINATSETGYGLEAAYLRGPFHFAGETHWQKVSRPGGTNPTFFGGYAEVGYFLTKGDTRGYKGGAFDRTKPANGADKGGIGAIEVNLRYDYLDLNDAGITGGKQKGLGVSVVWTPIAYARFIANYGRMKYSDAAIITATGDRDYSVDAMGVRAQFDF